MMKRVLLRTVDGEIIAVVPYQGQAHEDSDDEGYGDASPPPDYAARLASVWDDDDDDDVACFAGDPDEYYYGWLAPMVQRHRF